MNFKNLSSLSILALGLCFGANNIKPAQAFELETLNQKSTLNSPLLLSQSRGHDTYMGEPQIEWGDNVLGRVIAKSGGILFIKVDDGMVFHANGSFCPGTDVLVSKNADGGYSLIDRAHSQWISVLQSKYGYKISDGTMTSLNSRTAALWAEINSSRSMTREIPPRTEVRQETTFTPAPQVEQYNQPIRGLW